MGNRRDYGLSGVIKSNKAAIEQVVHAGRQQQAIFTIQTLFIISVAPGFAMAGSQMLWARDTGDPTGMLQEHDTLFEEALPTSRQNKRLLFRVHQGRICLRSEAPTSELQSI